MRLPPHRRLLRTFAAALLLLAGACGDTTPDSERAARAFVEAYYVRADLVAAGRLASGLAKEKVDRQAKLRLMAGANQGAAPVSPGLSKQREVTYEVLEVRDREGGRKIYRIGLTIVSSPVTLETQTLITVGPEAKGGENAWRVLNFVEHNRLPRGSGK